MKKLYVYLLLSIFSSPAFAEVTSDYFHQLAPSSNPSLHFIIEHDDLKDADGLLFNPICIGPLQSPARITDLNAFFESHTGTRVIERGNRRYLLVQKADFGAANNLSTTEGTSAGVYAELEFSEANDGTFVPGAAPAFFTDMGMSTSSCLAGAIHESDQHTS